MADITLSPDQQEAVDLFNKSKQTMFFLTGKAGSGKSTVISRLRNKRVTALTGLAASNVLGCTLHAFMGLTPYNMKPNMFKFQQRLFKSDFLIIDEVSMMNYEMFEILLECLNASKFKGNVILVGDFKQLSPIRGEPCYSHPAWSCVEEVSLTTNHRQSDDEFISFLNKARDGEIDMNYLEPKIDLNPPRDYTRLVPLRKEAHVINTQRLNELGTPPHLFDVKIYGKPRMDAEAFIDKNTNFESELVLKEGSRVMTIVNDKKYRYVNGSVGTLQHITNSTLTIKLDDGHLIEVEKFRGSHSNADGKVLFEYCQFPVMLAWATTIHKSQGQSIEKLHVNLRNNFASGMSYVALSRATNPNTLLVTL